ncbi:MAG TPA: hypothetical protein VH277_10250 [Gemmatimonadaceae bacterium]|jgi:hypothetical protein|nr:hypothetical protein [Gemmatimonadaceae bacterium]
MRRDLDWDQVRTEWWHGADIASLVAAAELQMTRARRHARLNMLVETTATSAGVGFVALALRHAGGPWHAALGLLVGCAICGVWLWHRALERDDQRSSEVAGSDHLKLVRRLRRSQWRAAWSVQIVIILDLIFLIPWWITGSRVHSRRLTDGGSLATVGLPLAGMLALSVWARIYRTRAKRDIDALSDPEHAQTYRHSG